MLFLIFMTVSNNEVLQLEKSIVLTVEQFEGRLASELLALLAQCTFAASTATKQRKLGQSDFSKCTTQNCAKIELALSWWQIAHHYAEYVTAYAMKLCQMIRLTLHHIICQWLNYLKFNAANIGLVTCSESSQYQNGESEIKIAPALNLFTLALFLMPIKSDEHWNKFSWNVMLCKPGNSKVGML